MRDGRDAGRGEMYEQCREGDTGKGAFGGVLQPNVAQWAQRPDVGCGQATARIADDCSVREAEYDAVAGLFDPGLPHELSRGERAAIDHPRVHWPALVTHVGYRCRDDVGGVFGCGCHDDVGSDLRGASDAARDRKRLRVRLIDAPRKRRCVRGGDP